jgi:hypothetical protein
MYCTVYVGDFTVLPLRREDPDPDPEEHVFMDPDPVHSSQLTYLDPVRGEQWSNPAPQRQPAPATKAMCH